MQQGGHCKYLLRAALPYATALSKDHLPTLSLNSSITLTLTMSGVLDLQGNLMVQWLRQKQSKQSN